MTAKLWSVTDGSEVATLGLPGCVLDAEFSSDGRYILCGNGRWWSFRAGWIKPSQGYLATLFECAS